MNQQLKETIERVKAKFWHSEENKQLLNLIADGRLKIEPTTIRSLDGTGFNHLEIISICQMIGKPYNKLPTADLDLLEMFEETKGVKFVDFDRNNPSSKNLSGFLSCFDSQGRAQRSSALLVLTI